MNMKKLIAGGLAGGIAFFFLGWVVYGMLLMDFMSSHSRRSDAFRSEADMIFWAMIVGNLAYGFLVSFVVNRTENSTVAQGASTGFITGLLYASAVNFVMYAQIDLFGKKVMAVDILTMAVLTAVIGALIAWVGSKMK